MNPTRSIFEVFVSTYCFVQRSLYELQEKVTWPTVQEVEMLLYLFMVGLAVCALLVFSLDIASEKIMRTIYAYFT